MKLHIASIACAAIVSSAAMAETHVLKGSDTLAGVMTDALIAAGLDDEISYQGGGSGLGEAAIVAKQQGIAPMSRAFKPEQLAAAQAAGILPKAHVIGLDGIGVFVFMANHAAKLTLAQLKSIYTCETTTWQQIPGSDTTGPIAAYRRNDNSGTTDAFKTMVGVSAFGACVHALADTADIAHKTETDPNAIGYSGMTARRDDNRPVSIAKDATTAGIFPTVATIRAKTYPLARDLYVYEASGSFTPNTAEAAFLHKLIDRSFLDPILQDNDFYTID